MKAHGLTLAAVAVALCAVLLFVVHPSALGLLGGPHMIHANFLAVAGIATLRQEHADLVKRAADKFAEIKDGLKPEEIRAIEDDHKKLLADIEAKKRELDAAEQAERDEQARGHDQPAAWSAGDIAKIKARAAAFGLDGNAALDVMADPKVRSLEAATDALQARAAEQRGQTPRQQPHMRITRDEGETVRTAVETAIMLRANPQAIRPTDQPNRERIEMAREWRGMRLMEMGRLYLEQAHGVRLRGLGPMEMAASLLGMETLGRAAGMLSTSDFANILANVTNKRLRDAYAQAPSYWKQLGRQSNSADFKQKSVVQLSSAPAFKQVREGGEFQYGGMTDGVEKYALATYGRIIAITRQTLINDDLGAFDRLPMMLGRQAAELEATTFWSILTTNAAMNDGTALFHADHGNLLTGSAIDTTNLGLGRAAMRKQKSLAAKAADREALNVVPRFLVNGPDKEVEGQQALTAVLAAQSGNVNVFAGSLNQITEARLTGNAWYLFADPATIDTIEYSYLDGEEGLFVEQRIGFEVDGIEVKGRLDFAAKAIDWRGMQKNPGN